MPDETAKSDSLHETARQELACLWNDLNDARRSAANGEWSMRCDHLVWRIEALTKHVGATPWEEIQIPLLEDGVYQRVHSGMGISVDVDMVRVAEVRASINARRIQRLPQ